MIRYNTKRYWGYSADTKPINAQIGDRFLELDTTHEYVFSSYNNWIPINKTPLRMTTSERDSIPWSNGDAGVIIYNIDDSKHQGWDGSSWNNFY